MKRMYIAQRQTTRYLANQMIRVGAPAVLECFAIPVDNQAPMPSTFREKERNYANSNLLLDRSDGKCCILLKYVSLINA